MIDQMNPCAHEKEDGSICGCQDFSLTHKIEGTMPGEETMVVTVRCNGCNCSKPYTVNIRAAVNPKVIAPHNELNPLPEA